MNRTTPSGWTPEELVQINSAAAPKNDRFSKLRKQAFEGVWMAHRILSNPRNYWVRPDLPLTLKSIDEEVDAMHEAGIMDGEPQETLTAAKRKELRKIVRVQRVTRNRARKQNLKNRKREVEIATRFLQQLREAISPLRESGRRAVLDWKLVEVVSHLAAGETRKASVISVYDSEYGSGYNKDLHTLRTTLPRFCERVYDALQDAYPNRTDRGSGLFQPTYVTDGMIGRALEEWCGAELAKDIHKSIAAFRWAATRHYDLLRKKRH